MIDFFAQYGWWMLLLFGAAWWIRVGLLPPTANVIGPTLVGVVGVVTFLWGVIVTVYATGGVPKVITGYGSGKAEFCLAQVNMERLQSFQKDYALAVICGIEDKTIDKVKSTDIAISTLRTIHPGKDEVLFPTNERLRNKAKEIQARGEIPRVWHVAVLLSKNIYLQGIHSLHDVTVQNGKILDPDLFNYQPN